MSAQCTDVGMASVLSSQTGVWHTLESNSENSVENIDGVGRERIKQKKKNKRKHCAKLENHGIHRAYIGHT